MPTWPGTPHTFVHAETPDETLLNTNIRDVANFFKNLFDNSANLTFPAPSTLTLTNNATGAITPTQNRHKVDTNGAAATGILQTITIAGNISDGCLLLLRAANSGHAVTVQTGTGNMVLRGGDCVLDVPERFLVLLLDGTTWYEVARSDGSGFAPNVPTLCGGTRFGCFGG